MLMKQTKKKKTVIIVCDSRSGLNTWVPGAFVYINTGHWATEIKLDTAEKNLRNIEFGLTSRQT